MGLRDLLGKGITGVKDAYSGATSVSTGINGVVTAGLGAAGNAIAGGKTSGVGNAVNGLADIASAIPGIGGLIGGVAGKTLGTLTNMAFGSKLNEENIQDIEQQISNVDAGSVMSASSYDDLVARQATQQDVQAFDKSFIGSDGWFANKAGNKYKELKTVAGRANARQDLALTENAQQIMLETRDDMLANYAKLGGKLDMSGTTGKKVKAQAKREGMTLAEYADHILGHREEFSPRTVRLADSIYKAHNRYANGGGIHINPDNRGKFTESASRAGMGVQEYARHVLANKDDYSPTQVRRANFARNAAKWHADGGGLDLAERQGMPYVAAPDATYVRQLETPKPEFDLERLVYQLQHEKTPEEQEAYDTIAKSISAKAYRDAGVKRADYAQSGKHGLSYQESKEIMEKARNAWRGYPVNLDEAKVKEMGVNKEPDNEFFGWWDIAQDTFLMDREGQKKIYEQKGFIPVELTGDPVTDYGPVRTATYELGLKRGEKIPVYQRPDGRSADGLVNLGFTYKIENSAHTGFAPSIIYADPDTGDLYFEEWDLNDYGGNSGTKPYAVTVGGWENLFKNDLYTIGDTMDLIGSPIVYRSGIQPLTPYYTYGDDLSKLTKETAKELGLSDIKFNKDGTPDYEGRKKEVERINAENREKFKKRMEEDAGKEREPIDVRKDLMEKLDHLDPLQKMAGQYLLDRMGYADGGDLNGYYGYLEDVANTWAGRMGTPTDLELLALMNANDYDYKGYYDSTPKDRLNLPYTDADHWPDTYKTAYHPTFSNESVYSGKKSQHNPSGRKGGAWDGDTYVPEKNKFDDGGIKTSMGRPYSAYDDDKSDDAWREKQKRQSEWTNNYFDEVFDELRARGISDDNIVALATAITQQAGNESGWGQDEGPAKANNYAGIMDPDKGNKELISYKDMRDGIKGLLNNLDKSYPDWRTARNTGEYTHAIMNGVNGKKYNTDNKNYVNDILATESRLLKYIDPPSVAGYYRDLQEKAAKDAVQEPTGPEAVTVPYTEEDLRLTTLADKYPALVDIVKALDPTGVTSWGDVINSSAEYMRDRTAGNFAKVLAQTVGALPMLGKGKLLSLLKKNGAGNWTDLLYKAALGADKVDDIVNAPTRKLLKKTTKAVEDKTSEMVKDLARSLPDVLNSAEKNNIANSIAIGLNIANQAQDMSELGKDVYEAAKANGGKTKDNDMTPRRYSYGGGFYDGIRNPLHDIPNPLGDPTGAVTVNNKAISLVAGPLGLELLASGGGLGTHGGQFSNGLTEINSGSIHELNQYGGVPMGQDAEGTPNVVEEGETIYDDYVYSNRIKIPDWIKDKYKLGRKKGGYTFADASKKLAKESKERPNDPISQRGLDAAMGDLANAQETVKAAREAGEAQAMNDILMAQAAQAMPYAYGGKVNKFDGNGSSKLTFNNAKQQATLNSGEANPLWPQIVEWWNKQQANGVKPVYNPSISGDTPLPNMPYPATASPNQIATWLTRTNQAGGKPVYDPSISGDTPLPAYSGSYITTAVTPADTTAVTTPAAVTTPRAASPIQNPYEIPESAYHPSYTTQSVKSTPTATTATPAASTAATPTATTATPAASTAATPQTSGIESVPVAKNRGLQYQYAGDMVPSGKDWAWDLRTLMNSNYGFSKNAGNTSGTYRIDPSVDARAVENTDLHKAFTDYVLNNSDTEGIQSYLKWLDANSGNTTGKLFDAKTGKLVDNWQDLYKRRRTDGKYGVYHLNPEIAFNAVNAPQVPHSPSPIPTSVEGLEEMAARAEATRTQQGIQDGTTDFTGGNYWYRYAPLIASGALTLTDLLGLTNKPDYTSANLLRNANSGYMPIRAGQLGDYRTYKPFDRNYWTNQLMANNAADRRVIMDSSGLNGGAAAARMMQQRANETKSLGELARQAEEYNWQRRGEVAEFNRQTAANNISNALSAAQSNQNAYDSAMDRRASNLYKAATLYQNATDTADANRTANLSAFLKGLENLGNENIDYDRYLMNLAAGTYGPVREEYLPLLLFKRRNKKKMQAG